MHNTSTLWCMLQKSKSTRRKKEQEAREVLPKLTEDEKGDIVNQAVEALKDAIQQVCRHAARSLGRPAPRSTPWLVLRRGTCWHTPHMQFSSSGAEPKPRSFVSCRPK